MNTKLKRTLLLLLLLLAAIPFVQLFVNKLYSLHFDKTYSHLDDVSSSDVFEIKNVTIKAEHYISTMYLDTIHLVFKVAVTSYIEHNNEETDYITFDKTGKIIEMDKFIPRQTETDYLIDQIKLDGNGRVIEQNENIKMDSADYFKNSIPLKEELSISPKWKDKSSPIYIKHFSKERFNISALNPFKFAGINGNPRSGVWYGFAYCDINMNDHNLKVKIPFGYENFFLTTDGYFSNLSYYSVPENYLPILPVRFLLLSNKLYMITLIQK